MIETLYQKYLEAKKNITTDSRNITPGCMFFALKGDSFDGNKFAEEAIKKGALCSVIDNKNYQTKSTILVDDVLKSLQQLANYYRNKTPFKVLGLTGTNGKTTTKELIHSVLSTSFLCSATKGNLNNHIGVPLTILSTPADTEILIVEMGANHQGEITELCKIAEPDCGLITNIGRAHLDGFGGYEGVKKAKSELYKYLVKDRKTIFINAKDSVLGKLLSDYKEKIEYNSNNSECYIEKTNFTSTLEASINISGQNYIVKTQMFGKYNAENIITAVCVGNHFEVSGSKIIQAIENYRPSNIRSQIKKTETNTLIVDCYNANPTSMHSAISSFNDIEGDRKIVILGEMKELGGESMDEHLKLVDAVKQQKLRDYIFIGEEFNSIDISDGHYFKTTKEFIDFIKSSPYKNSIILIKGSRTNRLEEIINYL